MCIINTYIFLFHSIQHNSGCKHSMNGMILKENSHYYKQKHKFLSLKMSRLRLKFTLSNMEQSIMYNLLAFFLDKSCRKRDRAGIVQNCYLNTDRILYCIQLNTANRRLKEQAIKNYLNKLDMQQLLRFCILCIQQRMLCI